MESEGSSSSVVNVKSQISTCLGGKDFNACNKHTDGSNIVFWPSQERDAAAAENKEARYLEREIKVFQPTAAQHAAEEISQVPPFLGSGDSCDWRSHAIEPYTGLSDKYDVWLSETCQRKFVMFDLEHSKSKKTIFIHPATIDEITRWLPHDSSNLEDHIDHLHSLSMRAVSHLKESKSIQSISGFSRLDSSFKFHKAGRCSESSFCHAYHPESSSLVSVDQPSLMCQGIDIDCIDAQGYKKEATLKYDDEDSEDIEALLCSDDETGSTGHSPSDPNWDNFPHLIYDDSGDPNRVGQFIRKTRKMDVNDTGIDSRSSSSGGVALADLDESLQSVDFPLNEMKRNMDLDHCRGDVYVTKAEDASTTSSGIKTKFFRRQQHAKRATEQKAKHSLHHIRRAWIRRSSLIKSSSMLRLCRLKSGQRSRSLCNR